MRSRGCTGRQSRQARGARLELARKNIGTISRFVRVILAQGPCYSVQFTCQGRMSCFGSCSKSTCRRWCIKLDPATLPKRPAGGPWYGGPWPNRARGAASGQCPHLAEPRIFGHQAIPERSRDLGHRPGPGAHGGGIKPSRPAVCSDEVIPRYCRQLDGLASCHRHGPRARAGG